MASMTLAKLRVVLEAATGSYKRDMKGAGKDTTKFSKRASKALKGLAVGGFAVATAAAAKFANDSIKEFRDFEKASSEVFTLLPELSGEAMASMRRDMLDFSQDAGRTTDETIPALYQAISAGVPRENVFDFMEVASDAALGGVTDLETAVDALTSVTNAYGEGAITAQEASDILFTGVRLGKTTMDELSASMSDVTPLAAALGVEFGDVTAALAAMTAQGTDTSKATIQLRGLLQELSKEGTVASEAFREAAGVGFADFIAQGGNLAQALQLMEEQAAETNVPIQDMFGNVRAGLGALQLTGKGAETFTANLEEMEGAAGATATAADEMGSTVDQMVRENEAAMESLKITAGESLGFALNQFLALSGGIRGVTEELQRKNITAALGRQMEDLGTDTLDVARATAAVRDSIGRFNQGIEDVDRVARRASIALDLLEDGFDGNAHELKDLIDEQEQEVVLQERLNAAIEEGRTAVGRWGEAQALAKRQAEDTGSALFEETETIEEQADAVERLLPGYSEIIAASDDRVRGSAAAVEAITEESRATRDARRASLEYARALEETELALGGYFEKALDGRDINEDLLGQFLSLAARQGASESELRAIAQATENYTDEQIDAAVGSARLQTEFQKLTEAWSAGRITTDEMTEAVRLLEQGERDTASAAIGLATTMDTEVASALHQTQQNALDTKLGVGDMSEEMGEVPPVTESEFDDKDTYSDGISEAERLLEKLDALDGKTTTSTHTTNFVQGGTAGASGGGQGGNFQHGGFTGGQPNQPAGIVHGQEFVFSAPAVRNVGVRFLSDLHESARDGGAMVSGDGGGDQRPIEVNIFPQTAMQMRPEEIAGAIGRKITGRG